MDAKSLHARYPIVDGHADSVERFLEDPAAFFSVSEQGHLDSVRLRAAQQNLQVMAVFTPPDRTDLAALQYVLDFVDAFHRILDSEANARLDPPYLEVRSRAELQRASRPGAYGLLLFLEGASPLRGRLSNLRSFFRLGVRGVTLTHNHDNEAARGCYAEGEGRGLTEFGRQLVTEMNRLGMVLDLAHSNEDTFWQALELSSQPPIDSHTGLRHFSDTPRELAARNLSDAQLQALARKGGVACIDFVPDHLKRRERKEGQEPEPATIADVVRNILHAAEVAGIDHVGLGSDWDGFAETVRGLEQVSALPGLTEALIREGLSEEQIAKVLGLNLLRVLSAVLPP
jgi:membrane dipeptidase